MRVWSSTTQMLTTLSVLRSRSLTLAGDSQTSLITPERLEPLLAAGLDKINVSVDGMNEKTYMEFTGFKFDFQAFVNNVKWLYLNKGNCEVVIKIPSELVTKAQREEFFQTFGNYSDRSAYVYQ